MRRESAILRGRTWRWLSGAVLSAETAVLRGCARLRAPLLLLIRRRLKALLRGLLPLLLKTAVRGLLKKDASSRAEAMSLINKN